VTKESLIAGLKKIGVSGNQILEVHTRLSAFD
jgi:aminoglycoside N3'-acetyltransferase